MVINNFCCVFVLLILFFGVKLRVGKYLKYEIIKIFYVEVNFFIVGFRNFSNVDIFCWRIFLIYRIVLCVLVFFSSILGDDSNCLFFF